MDSYYPYSNISSIFAITDYDLPFATLDGKYLRPGLNRID